MSGGGWRAVTLDLPSDWEDLVLPSLQEAGTLGVHVEGPEDRSDAQAAGAGARVVAYFRADSPIETLLDELRRRSPGLRASVDTIPDGAWVETQETGRRPILLGARFLVLPEAPGSVAAAAGGGTTGRIPLVIPPRRAFGTGEHATTRLCMMLLERTGVAGRSVLDFGTGSGILALAALALGASRVLGVDDDPEAIEMARENVSTNRHLPGREALRLETGRLERAPGPYDLVLANILGPVLSAAAPELAARQPPGGEAIISGFSPEDADEVLAAFSRAGFEEGERLEEGEWVAVRVVRAAARARS